jgi:hypothetical protein
MPSLLEYFADLPEPRIDRCKKHELIDIIAIAILASICGAEHFTEMEEFGIRKEAWLRTERQTGRILEVDLVWRCEEERGCLSVARCYAA